MVVRIEVAPVAGSVPVQPAADLRGCESVGGVASHDELAQRESAGLVRLAGCHG
jgi:hypothetical protein